MNQFIKTGDLETLAKQLFNGGMAPLPLPPMKRRAALAAEFERAHIEIPGVSRRDAAKFAALGTPFKTIADARQQRANAYLAALAPRVTQADIRTRLVQVLGERALKVKLLNARHGIAAALVLLDRLEGRDTALDLDTFAAAKLVARLDAAFGKEARETLLPHGPCHIGAAARLAYDLADAVLDAHTPSVPATATTKPSPPTKPASKPAASAPMKLRDFDNLSARAKMDFVKAGGRLVD